MLRNDKGGNQLDRTQSRPPTPLLKHAKHATANPSPLSQSKLPAPSTACSGCFSPRSTTNSRQLARVLSSSSREGSPHRFSLHWLPCPLLQTHTSSVGRSRQRMSDPRPRRALEKFDARSIAVEEPSYILPPADVCRPRHAIGPRAPTMPTSRKSPLLIDAPLCPHRHRVPSQAVPARKSKNPHC